MNAIASLNEMRPVSADSHVTEPPDCYIDRIEPKFRDRAPRMVNDPVKGASFVIDGLGMIGIALAAAANIPPDQLKSGETRTFDMLYRGGWDPVARIDDMNRDGIHAELIYPSVGMIVYSAPDPEYRHACMQAYNRWLQEFVSAAPGRLFGIGQSPALTPDSFIEDLRSIKAMGFRGVMMPSQPGYKDYDDPAWDAAFAAAVDLELPLCFHVLVSQKSVSTSVRGSKVGNIMNVIRVNQDIINVLVFGGVFDRHPKLKAVCVEADAGWLPHYVYRMDHAYERFHLWLDSQKLSRAPSEYVRDNISFTFQDDWVAFQSLDKINPKSLMWATDFPHTDSTWPNSMSLLKEHTAGVDPALIRSVIHDNAVSLFKLDLAN